MIFTLQSHVLDHSHVGEDVRELVFQSFNMDNCVQSITTKEVQTLVDKLLTLPANAGFEL